MNMIRDEPARDWRCPSCGCRSFAQVDEQKADGTFGPGPLVRCVNCKDIFHVRLSPPVAVPDGLRQPPTLEPSAAVYLSQRVEAAEAKVDELRKALEEIYRECETRQMPALRQIIAGKARAALSKVQS